MSAREFLPNSKYQFKMMLVISLIAILILIGLGILSALISIDDPGAGLVVMAITFAGDAIFWVVAMLISVPYFRSLRYEIHEDEVIVHVGIITHSVKHVPYRTVTNITVNRDIFDRWFFNLGSLTIQTAGMSGQKGAEENLVGLEDVQEVYELVVTELRRFRGAMSPTTVQEELPCDGSAKLLNEVQAIRKLLEKSSPEND
ncbi:MAG TPA: PH domain-containing protein [Anaerolineales bacterium]|nr:PH domain-containing protein [Anaerolineales bacterium]